uniref:Uncharacterized protein n=1 Tax=Ananas comosus var. bracteatus TaxID=296719 RepID=A0A6V7Q6K1_ANACO|nr:unnamed protein product [Ananas comosus var. bracteatus]
MATGSCGAVDDWPKPKDPAIDLLICCKMAVVPVEDEDVLCTSLPCIPMARPISFLVLCSPPYTNRCFLSQHKYVLDILHRAHMEDAKPVSTSMAVDVTLSNSSHPLDASMQF